MTDGNLKFSQMKNNVQYILITGIVFITGLLAGRYFFSAPQGSGSEAHTHEHSKGTAEEVSIWTCSMDPQIRQPEPGLCPICGMELIPLDESGTDDPLTLTMTESAIRMAGIQTSRVGTGSVGEEGAESWLINGKILPDERQIYSQPPHINGRIESLYVTYEGMYITKDSKIAEIYSPEIIAAQREFLEALKLKDVNPRMMEAARNKLKFLKIPDSFIAELENTGEVVETFPLLAGESGYVLNKNVEVGDHVDDGQILFDIYNLNSLWAVFDVYEKDLSKIKIGDIIEFRVAALPDQVFRTRIDFINPLLDQGSRAVRIRGQISNHNRLLKPQMLIRGKVKISGHSQDGQLLVPKTAVLWTGRESVVYVKDTTIDIPSFSFREIVLGPATGSFYRVLSGLEPGEEVVTNGVFAVDASAQLNNRKSMVNRLVAQDMEVSGRESVTVARVDPDLVTEGAAEDLKNILEAYIRLKDVLVTGEEEAVKEAVRNLGTVLRELKERSDLGPHNDDWNRNVKNFGAHLKIFDKDEELEDWRQNFVALSDVLIRWVSQFGNPTDEELYIQHCPMANNDYGADWLSYDEKIRNPYYGESMMTCGVIQETL